MPSFPFSEGVFFSNLIETMGGKHMGTDLFTTLALLSNLGAMNDSSWEFSAAAGLWSPTSLPLTFLTRRNTWMLFAGPGASLPTV